MLQWVILKIFILKTLTISKKWLVSVHENNYPSEFYITVYNSLPWVNNITDHRNNKYVVTLL